MRTHRVSLLLLSAILNFTPTIYGHLYLGVPPIPGFNLYGNQVPHQPAFANQPTSDKLLDFLKEKLQNRLIIQNINRRSDLSNNIQEPALNSLRQQGQSIGQNNDEKVVNPNPQLLEGLREQNSGNTATQNGIDINKYQYILERLRQKDQNVAPNVGQYGYNPIFDLLQQLNKQNSGQLVIQNINRKLANFLQNNPSAKFGPNLQREQFVLQNIGKHNVLNPSIEDLLERLTQNNRGQLFVQNIDRPTPAHLHKESFVQNSNAESVPVGLQQHNHDQIAMHNVKEKIQHPEINYLNPLFEPQKLQHREKTVSQSSDQRPVHINFDNIEVPRLQQPSQVLIQSVKGLNKYKNSYLNSLLERLKGQINHVTIPFINPNKQRYQNNDLETLTLDDQRNNEHKHGLKHVINHKNYVSLNNNNIPFNQQVDNANRNLLMNIFIEKYIPENIKRILYNARTKAEIEKVQMLLKNYKVISYAFADFLRYSNPLAGWIKSLRIISENIKQRAKNDVVPVQIIQKEIEDLSQVGVDESGFSIKKLLSNPDVLVEDLNLRVKDIPDNAAPLQERPASNLNKETIFVPETNAEIKIKIGENVNVTNQNYTRLKDAMILHNQLNSDALHQTATISAPQKNIEEGLTVLHINEDAAPTVIGLDHHNERENYVLRDKHLGYNNDNNNSSQTGDITDKPKLVANQNDVNNSVVTQPHRQEIETKESVTEYIHDKDLKDDQNKARPNFRINTMIDEIFCKSLDTDEVIDVMEEVLYNVMGELNERFKSDGVILNVTRHGIMKTLHDKNVYSNKRCDNNHYDFRNTNI